MSARTFGATIERIRGHCLLSGQRTVEIVFHGGEPTLIGAARFGAMCETARDRLSDIAAVSLSIQTNGTRLDPAWLSVLGEHGVGIGVSLDGPREINDQQRVDHRGRGSYDAAAGGIASLREAGVPFSILSVVAPGADPLRIHHHFLSLGCKAISYVLPAYTHDTIAPVREQFGPTPCADFLIPIFDDWWSQSTIDVRIREFWEIGRTILGGASQLDSIGNRPIRFVSVETDGSIHGLDKLRACEDEMTATTLNVHEADFREIAAASRLHAAVMDGVPLPTGCRGCRERDTCGGGYLPHRYSAARGFDNPSVWCADLLALFAHVRARMGVTTDETTARRTALR